MKKQTEHRLEIEQLEDRIAPTGLGACLSTTASVEAAHAVDVNVASAATAASGYGVVTVTEGTCA